MISNLSNTTSVQVRPKAKVAYNYVLTAYYNKKKEEVLQLGENLLLNPSTKAMIAFYVEVIQIIKEYSKLQLKLGKANHTKLKSTDVKILFSLCCIICLSQTYESQVGPTKASFLLTQSAYSFFDTLNPQLI